MKKVLYVGMTESLGGIESFVINFWRNFDKDRISIDFLKLSDNIYFEDEIVNGGSKVFRIENRRSNPFKHISQIVKFLKNHPEYEIIHFHLLSASNIEPVIIAKLLGRKIVIHSHSQWKGNDNLSNILHKINKPILNFIADKKLACSKEAGEWMYGKNSYQIIKNAIDTKKYKFDINIRNKVRDQFNFKNEFVIGNVGRLVSVKNQEFLIDLFKRVHEKDINTKLIIVGEGELRQQLEKKISQYNLENNIVLTGLRNDVNELMQGMDIFILPSHFEGLPLVAVEAQASGLPCIISENVSSEACIIKNSERIALEDGIEKWSERVLYFRDNVDRIGCYEDIKKSGYDIENEVEKLLQIYEELN